MQSDYFNRRVFTETGDNQTANSEIDKVIGKISFNFSKTRGCNRASGNVRKQDRNIISGGKEKNLMHSIALEIPKTNVVIATNNIHQNISIFTEERVAPKKTVQTEGPAKELLSKDRLAKRDSKKQFQKIRFRKDKRPSGNRKEDIKLNKSKDWKEGHGQTISKERHLKTQANEQNDNQLPQIEILQKVGQGTFGQVFKARLGVGGKIVAVKRVFQDRKYKNRELQILKILHHEFVLKVLFTFLTKQRSKKGDEDAEYLNVVMEYYEHNLYQINCEYKRHTPDLDIKLYIYQLFRGLAYIHSTDICHRDIKPPNILVNKKTSKLVICDFGSAKKLIKGEPNIAYICSRCYRAPELIFGSVNYTSMIDIWSAGCVLLQLLKGQPFFIGDSNVDQLVQIIKVLGTPSKTEVVNMNPDYDLDDYKFPKIKTKQWTQIFPQAEDKLISFIKQIMIYSPKQRLNAVQAIAHQYFDELREQHIYKQLQIKRTIPPLFDFTKEQLRGNDHLLSKILPTWYKPKRN